MVQNYLPNLIPLVCHWIEMLLFKLIKMFLIIFFVVVTVSSNSTTHQISSKGTVRLSWCLQSFCEICWLVMIWDEGARTLTKKNFVFEKEMCSSKPGAGGMVALSLSCLIPEKPQNNYRYLLSNAFWLYHHLVKNGPFHDKHTVHVVKFYSS